MRKFIFWFCLFLQVFGFAKFSWLWVALAYSWYPEDKNESK
jgi:hypothetical protein